MTFRAYWKKSLCLSAMLLFAMTALVSAGIFDEFLPVVGVWRMEKDGGKQVLKVDGSVWKRGQVAAELQQSSSRLFGEKAGEFVKVFPQPRISQLPFSQVYRISRVVK